MRRNLNSDASNLNFMARSFHKMPTRFSAMRSIVFALHSRVFGSRENTSVLARGDIYIRSAKKRAAYRFSDV